MEDLIHAYGGPGLALASFVAATLVPMSSEVALVAAVKLGLSRPEALVWASIGNCIGITVNYFLGYWGSQTVLRRTLSGRMGTRALNWSNRFGKWTLLASWLPFIGDPLTLVAGIMRVDFIFFLVVAAGTRILRYGLIILVL